MSRLTEYLKLLPKAILNIDKVVEGIRNNIKLENGDLPQDEEDEIVRRRLICSQCPYESDNMIKANLYATKRKDLHCTACGCEIFYKTASLESECGLADYNSTHPDDIRELKWTKYKD